MAAVDPERLRRVLGGRDLAPLRARLRERLARGGTLSGRMRWSDLGREQRDAVAALFGLPPGAGRYGSLQISLDALDEQLRAAGVCGSLREAVEALEGRVANRTLAQAETAAAWSSVFREARRDPIFAGTLAGYLDRLPERGLLKRLSAGDPSVAADLRPAWAAVGVLCDELSTPALALNLPALGDTPLGRFLREAAAAGEPLHLSLRILLRHPLADDPAPHGRDVYVCENPSLVALAAARLGARCRPLVCASGQPATPVQVLLRQLAAAGARLHYHGDFDCGGLRMARYVIERFGARPWRMNVSDYLEAAHLGRPMQRKPGASPWDVALAAAMAREGRALHEELVADSLLADLNG